MTLETLESVPRWASVLVPAASIAERIAGTEFVPKAMRGKPDVVTAAILYGDELDIGPMQALQSINVIEGKPAPSAELCRALIFRAGHTVTVHELTGTKARISGLRAGRPETERLVIEWNMEMAKAAGLLGRPVWRQYPRAMLLARATSDLARALFPDVIKGMGYIAEDELTGAELDGWRPLGAPEPEPTPRATVGRKTRATKRALSAPESPAERPAAPPAGDRSPDEPEGPQIESERPPVAPELDQPIAEPPQTLMPEHQPPETPSAQIGPGQLRGLQALFRDILGDEATSDDRHAVAEAILGTPVADTSKITRRDASRLFDALSRINDGRDGITYDETGQMRIITYAEPPDDLEPPGTTEPLPGMPEPDPQFRPRPGWERP